jgi:hypothetical protein
MSDWQVEVLEIPLALIPPDPLLARLLRLRMEFPELRLSHIAELAGTDNNRAYRLLRNWRLSRAA